MPVIRKKHGETISLALFINKVTKADLTIAYLKIVICPLNKPQTHQTLCLIMQLMVCLQLGES